MTAIAPPSTSHRLAHDARAQAAGLLHHGRDIVDVEVHTLVRRGRGPAPVRWSAPKTTATGIPISFATRHTPLTGRLNSQPIGSVEALRLAGRARHQVDADGHSTRRESGHGPPGTARTSRVRARRAMLPGAGAGSGRIGAGSR